ncbi:hypothetical protein ACFHW1_04915 [Micromonospora sp. LOL_014]|uniref:phage distal tail protein n=1 Tax=Micromonospora sp. LOL_014 TaxID=3345415 RepID=UPI003A855A95
MPLAEGQIQIRDLVLGPGTPYNLSPDSNPLALAARATQTGARAWANGSWSGVEWADERAIPLRLMIQAQPASTAGWLTAWQQLAAAMAPSHTDVPLRWALGGVERLMWVRPRMAEPDLHLIADGRGRVRLGLVALDPLVYAGDESSDSTGLPVWSGGLTAPFTVPVTIGATRSSGAMTVVNSGTADVGLILRVDGPAVTPRVTLVPATGDPQVLTVDIELGTGQWLDIDTRARTVLLNGTSSRRGVASGDWPIVPPGTSELRYDAAQYNGTSTLTATWRSAWW